MRIVTAVAAPLEHRCQVLVLGFFADGDQIPLHSRLDKALGGGALVSLHKEGFSGKPNTTRMIHTLGKLLAERILVVGLGKRDELTAERLRQGAGTAVQALASYGLTGFSTVLHLAGNGDLADVKAVTEGFHLAGYSFTQYKSVKEGPAGVDEVTLLFSDKKTQSRHESGIKETAVVCDAVCFARDLVSHPGNIATPAFLAEQSMAMSAKSGITCRILEREDLERLGMEAILGVGKGSRNPPKFIVLEYRPLPGGSRPVVLVGKGVTFDSGGISLKPREGMEMMKDDMAGAAAVMGTLMAVAALKLRQNVVGLIPAAENLPGGGAYKPGDVVRSMSGQTIEILNTDAEGRLILADAITYAKRLGCTHLVDAATLTGAIVVALGYINVGVFANDDTLAGKVLAAAKASGEKMWQMPIDEEYKEVLKSAFADIPNIGNRWGGAITAAMFLKEFVETTPWVHLDIAGTAWIEEAKPFLAKGPSGVPVRTLVGLALNWTA